MALPSGARVVPGDAEFPVNQWYVAAFSNEVERGKLLHRTLLDQPVVLYRDREGRPVALFDRCPHRFLRKAIEDCGTTLSSVI